MTDTAQQRWIWPFLWSIAGVSLLLQRHLLSDCGSSVSGNSDKSTTTGSSSPDLALSLSKYNNSNSLHPEDCLSSIHQDLPKVALLFVLDTDAVPHAPTWKAWLEAAEGLIPAEVFQLHTCAGTNRSTSLRRDLQQCLSHQQGAAVYQKQFLFSVYIHLSAQYDELSPSSIFYGRNIKDQLYLEDGGHSWLDITRLLLTAALKDEENCYFQLLGDSSVPLYPPQLTYMMLLTERHSRVAACPQTADESDLVQWSKDLMPFIHFYDWRKSSSWFSLTRNHAEVVEEDDLVSDMFAMFCNDKCSSRQHYIPSLLSYTGLAGETTCHGNTVRQLTPREAGVTRQRPTGNTMAGGIEYQSMRSLLVKLRRAAKAGNSTAVSMASCMSQEAIRSAEVLFVSAADPPPDLCTPLPPFCTTCLPATSCSLFADGFHPLSLKAVAAAVKSCDTSLAMAPQQLCASIPRTKLRLNIKGD